MRKRLYCTIFLPTIAYAAAAWHRSLDWKRNRDRLEGAQRTALIWTCSAYCTVSKEQALLLANEPPISLIVKKATSLHQTKMRNSSNLPEMRKKHEQRILEAMDNLQTGALIRSVSLQSEADRGELVNYWTSQFLTGHGAFRGYLHRFGLAESPICRFCMLGAVETPNHILFICEQFDDIRAELLENSSIHGCHSGGKAYLSEEEIRNFTTFCKTYLNPKQYLGNNLSD